MDRKKGRPRKRPNKKEFEMIYYNNSMTIYEICDFWGVTPQTVYNWAHHYKKERA